MLGLETNIPNLPEGSNITVEQSFEGIRLSWPNPTGGIMRYGAALFMLFWLGGWAFGEIMVIRQLIYGEKGAHDLFLIFWLGGWTVGGIWVMWMIYRMLQPPKAEQLTLATDHLTHFPGTEPMNPFSYSSKDNPFRNPIVLMKKPKRIKADRQTIGEIRLSNEGERQRLTFDLGADRVEIGKHLREPEREWLAEVLTAWSR